MAGIAVSALVVSLLITVSVTQAASWRQLQAPGSAAGSTARATAHHGRHLLQPGTVVSRLSPGLLQQLPDGPAPSQSPSPRPGRFDHLADITNVVLVENCGSPGDLIKGPPVLEEAKEIEYQLQYANYYYRTKLGLPQLVLDKELAKRAGDMVVTCNASAVDNFVVGSIAGVKDLGKAFDIWSQDKSDFFFALRSKDYRRVGCAGNVAGCCRGRHYICFLSTSCVPIGGGPAAAAGAAAACGVDVAVVSALQAG